MGNIDRTKIDISVIIPAYNAEATIRRAIESILAQKKVNYEIIIVENGSSDRTVEICSEISSKHESVHLYHSDKGVSKARNAGLNRAKGEWICFVDADDYLYPDAFETLFSDIRKMSDMILFDHSSEKSRMSKKKKKINVFKGEECLDFKIKMLKKPTKYMAVWGKLFRNRIIKDNRLYFSEKLSFSEDSDFTFRYCQNCNVIMKTDDILYHYSRSDNSTVRTYKKGIAENYILALKHTKKYTSKETQKVQKAFHVYVLMHLLLILVHDTYAIGNPAPERERKIVVKKLCHYNIFREALKKIGWRDLNSLQMVPIFCLKYHCYELAIQVVKIRVKLNQIRSRKDR